MLNKVNFTHRRRGGRCEGRCGRGHCRWDRGKAGGCRVENREQDLQDDDKPLGGIGSRGTWDYSI